MSGGTPEFQRGLGRNWLDVRHPPHPVRSENLGRLHHMVTRSLRLDLGAIGVADEYALLIHPKRQGRIFQRKFIKTRGALNDSAPILIVTPNNVSPFVPAATDRGQIHSGDRPSQSLVVS